MALRVAAVWGTTVVALKTLERGESFVLGEADGAVLPIPDGDRDVSAPLRAAQGGWELDARGCVGGLLTLRGRAEDPVAIARAGAPVPVMPGDYGLIQYGQFSIFFQYTAQPIAMSSLRGPELLALLAIFCSAILHLGVLGLVRTLMTPPSAREAARAHEPRGVRGALRAEARASSRRLRRRGRRRRRQGRRQRREGSRRAGQEGARRRQEDQGRRRQVRHERQGRTTRALPGEIKPTTHYGGLSEVLEGDTGKEIQNTLKSINTVSAALAGSQLEGPRPRRRPRAPASRAPARGGGGTGAGVAFGSGTLDTGFGAGNGGGYGAGGGGPGGRGTGGNGKGGAGGGTGHRQRARGGGPGEAKVAVGAGGALRSGGLSPEQVRRVVMAHIGAVRACYESEAQRNPGLKGGVTVAWQIDAERQRLERVGRADARSAIRASRAASCGR